VTLSRCGWPQSMRLRARRRGHVVYTHTRKHTSSQTRSSAFSNTNPHPLLDLVLHPGCKRVCLSSRLAKYTHAHTLVSQHKQHMSVTHAHTLVTTHTPKQHLSVTHAHTLVTTHTPKQHLPVTRAHTLVTTHTPNTRHSRTPTHS